MAGPQVFFSNQDALTGIEVITNNFSAQYGRNAGSVVDYLTKSGTNQFHGSLFEYYEGNWGESFAQGQKSPYQGYCAKGESPSDGCTTPTLTRFTRNTFGFTIGGPVPIMKDKLWFFSSGYWDRNHAGGGELISGAAYTPTPTGLATLQANFPSAPGTAALVNQGPYSIKTGNPHPGQLKTVNVLPTGAIGAAVPVEFGQIVRSVPSQSNDEELLERMDWQPTGKDHFFVRYFYQNDPFIFGGGSAPAGNWYDVPDVAHSIGADWSRTLTPSLVNQIRYSFQQTALDFQAGALPKCTVTTPDQCTARMSFSSSSLLTFGYAANIPQGRTVKVTQAQDNVTWTKGKQTILMGGEWDYQDSPNPFLPDYNGAFGFSSFNKFMAGVSTLTLGNGNGFTTKFTEPDAAAYFQDDWKISPSLTLNLGLRWEFFGQAVNLLHDQTVKRESNAATAFWDQSLPLYVRTVNAAPNHYKEFQPRVGFALNPAMDKKLVVRGGFSINFDPAFYNMFLNTATAAPVVNLGSISGCGTTKVCMPGSGVKGADVRSLDLPYIPVGAGINPGLRNQTTVSKNFHDPYTESWILGVSHQLGSKAVAEVDYVGNHQVGNFMSANANPNLLALQKVYPSSVPATLCTDATQVGYGHVDCNRRNVRERNNNAFAEFNALEAKLTTRNYHGLTEDLNFTYSKTIDNVSEIFSTFAGGNTVAFAENPLNVGQPERGVSGDSLKFIGSADFGYLTPKIHDGHGLLGHTVGNLRLDGIWTFNTGQPMTPFQYGYFGAGPSLQSYSDVGFANWQLSGYDNARPVLANKSAPITSVGVLDDGSNCGVAGAYLDWNELENNGNCVTGSATSFHWLRNTQYLANQSNKPYIGIARNSQRGQAWNNFDLKLEKVTKLSERLSMNFSVIAYNALNRQFLGTPSDLDIDDVGPGSTFYDYRWNFGSNRNTQLKVDFQF